MRRVLHRVAVYFGVAELDDRDRRREPCERPVVVVTADSLLTQAVLILPIAAAQCVAVLVVFDWRPLTVVYGTAIGACIWGALCAVDLGAAFVPGQLTGYALAKLGGFIMVRRWQREHEVRVVSTLNESGEADLYALSPTSQLSFGRH